MAHKQYHASAHMQDERTCPHCGRMYFVQKRITAVSDTSRNAASTAVFEKAARLSDATRTAWGHFCPHCGRVSPRGIKILFPHGLRKGLLELHQHRLSIYQKGIPRFLIVIGMVALLFAVCDGCNLIAKWSESYLSWTSPSYQPDGSLESPSTQAGIRIFYRICIWSAFGLFAVGGLVSAYGHFWLNTDPKELLKSCSNEDLGDVIETIYWRKQVWWNLEPDKDVAKPKMFARWANYLTFDDE